MQDDFAFELGSSLLTKDRYLKSDDLARLREACGDTLRVAASDFRIDPGDDEAVLFTLAVSGVQSAPYKGLEDKDALKGSGPWKTLPTCGRCARFQRQMLRRNSRSASDGMTLARRETLACVRSPWGQARGLNCAPPCPNSDAPDAGYAGSGHGALIDAADAGGDAALREPFWAGGAPPDGVAAALFADDCVVLGEGFAAMPPKTLRTTALGRFDGVGAL